MSRKQTFLKALVAVLMFMGIALGQRARATEFTVTYRITETHNNYAYTFNFVRSGTSFGYSYGSKTAYVSNITSTTGFNVQLDDGLTLRLTMDQGQFLQSVLQPRRS